VIFEGLVAFKAALELRGVAKRFAVVILSVSPAAGRSVFWLSP